MPVAEPIPRISQTIVVAGNNGNVEQQKGAQRQHVN